MNGVYGGGGGGEDGGGRREMHMNGTVYRKGELWGGGGGKGYKIFY